MVTNFDSFLHMICDKDQMNAICLQVAADAGLVKPCFTKQYLSFIRCRIETIRIAITSKAIYIGYIPTYLGRIINQVISSFSSL